MAIAFGGIGLVAVDYGMGSRFWRSCWCWAPRELGPRQHRHPQGAPPDAFRFMVWVSVVPVLPLLLLSALTEGVGPDLDSLRHLTPSALAQSLMWHGSQRCSASGVAVLIRRYGANTVARTHCCARVRHDLGCAAAQRESDPVALRSRRGGDHRGRGHHAGTSAFGSVRPDWDARLVKVV